MKPPHALLRPHGLARESGARASPGAHAFLMDELELLPSRALRRTFGRLPSSTETRPGSSPGAET